MLTPGLELMGQENPPDRLRRDALDHPVGDKPDGQFRAIPLAQRDAAVIGTLAGHLHDVHRHDGGKRHAAGRDAACLAGPLGRL